MDQGAPKYPRILAITPSAAGFGFAVLEGQSMLVKWGSRRLRGDKNRETVIRVEKLLAECHPQVVVLEDTLAEDSRRRPRIRRLTKSIAALAGKRGVKAALFSRKQVMLAFLEDEKGTRHQLAELVAQRFPDELAHQLPPKRKFYDSEDYRIEIFMAVALALMLRRPKRQADAVGR